MHCRAYLLLEREYKRLQKNPEWGIKVTPSESNIFCWYATLAGLSNTIWENGLFHLTIEFSENYDFQPPAIRFNTIPFHPNIDPETGRPCLDVLDKNLKYSENIPISSILINIQALLANPVLDNPINGEASDLLKTSPHIYMQLVKNCVSESQNLTEMLEYQIGKNQVLEGNETKRKIKPIPSSSSSITKRPKQVSFDEYHRYWVRIASSQPTSYIPSMHTYMDGNSEYFRAVEGRLNMNSPYQREASATPSASKAITMDTEQKMNKLRQKKLQRISAMKQLYMNNANEKDYPGSTAPVSSLTDVAGSGKVGEIWEKEADDLVAWSASLREDSV